MLTRNSLRCGRQLTEKSRKLNRDLDFIVEDLHAHPELAFEEVRSQKVLADMLEKHGHSC